jgi:hypothetical protein
MPAEREAIASFAQTAGLRWSRVAQKISILAPDGSQGAESFNLSRFFYAFGNHLGTQFAGQCQDHADHVLADAIGLHAGDQ